MSPPTIFVYLDYKEFLNELILFLKSEQRFRISDLARKTGFQKSFFSRVLNGELQFTTEAAFKVAKALSLSNEETSYFFWLVELSRAADTVYKKYVEEQLGTLRKKYESVQKTQQARLVSPSAEIGEYLTAWTYVAFHLATAIPELQTIEKIAERFKMPISYVSQVLTHLESQGLVAVSSDRKNFRFEKGSVHFSADSPLTNLHHTHWRLKALESAQFRNRDSIHFTNVLTVSKDDYRSIRSLVLKGIESVMSVAEASDPQELVCFNLDYFLI